MMLREILMAVVVSTSPSPSDDGAVEDASRMANTFADCAGVWDWVSAAELANERRASAKQAKQTAHGAHFAAMWLASHAYHIENPEQRKPYGAFKAMFEGRREASYTGMMAMLERGDQEGLVQRVSACSALLEAQEGMINDVRKTFVE